MKKEKAKYIWHNGSIGVDEYAEFYQKFSAVKGEKTTLKISCDGSYAAFINGRLAAFYTFGNFPDHKYYQETDITRFCEKENEIKILVWYPGVSNQNYVAGKAGVIFKIVSSEKTLLISDKNILSRKMNEYKNGYEKVITSQLGFSFLYDNSVEKSGYSLSKKTGKAGDLHKIEIKGLNLLDRIPVSVIKKDNSVIIDMGKEVAGFLDIHIVSPVKQKLLITYGEHIKDGGVRRIIGDRDFSVEFVAKSGENEYMNTFRRIAGRYIEVFFEQPIEIKYMGIRPVVYPVKIEDRKFDDKLIKKIYDTCVYTLTCCMHEHYEDCPWREQGLYTLDSRNQILSGFYAFADGNIDYARYNLQIINKGLRKDGLLSICFPSAVDLTIPFFSLVYIIEVYEYVKHTGDTALLIEVEKTLTSIVKSFTERIEENGLIPTFPYPYWNFYEWAEESNNEGQIYRSKGDKHEYVYDLILNCAYVYAVKLYDEMTGAFHDTAKIKKAIKDTFYNGEDYKLSTKTNKSSQFGNAFAILIGLGDKKLAEKVINDKSMIEATLSVRTFLYDALLTFGDDYNDFILSDIKSKYKKMLDDGATTFWETAKGESDFDGAGSLCHGWSAIPVYYFNKLL